MFDKWKAMYIDTESRGKHWVCRVDQTGYISVYPHPFTSKKAATDYIKSYHLKPSKPF